MPGFGRFETVTELASSGPFSVYSARAPGEDAPPKFAIKTFITTADGALTLDDLADTEVVEARARAFLETAKLQQELGGASPEHWAPVYDFGRTPSHAYYITDLYDLTALKLIDSRREMTPAEIVRLVVGVAAGLEAIQKSRNGRGHGDLKPSNVMIAAPGNDLNQAKVYLIDPLSDARVSKQSTADDQRALADLLHQLAVFRPGPRGGTVQSGPEWAAMGKPGEVLRSACEWLLNPQPGAALPTFDEIYERLTPATIVEKKGGSKKLIIAAVAGAVLLAGGIGAWLTLSGKLKQGDGQAQNGGANGGTPEPEDKPNIVKGQNPTEGLKTLRERFVTSPGQRLAGVEAKVPGDAAAQAQIQGYRDQIAGWDAKITDLTERAAKAWAPIETPQGPNGPDPQAAQKAQEEQAAAQATIIEESTALDTECRGAALPKKIDGIIDDSLSRLIAFVKDKIDKAGDPQSSPFAEPLARDKFKAALTSMLSWLNSPAFDRSTGGFWQKYEPQVARLENYLKALEAGLPLPEAIPAPPGGLAEVGPLNDALKSARANVFKRMVDGVTDAASVKDASEAAADITAARTELDQQRAQMQATIADAVEIDRLLGLGYGLAEATGKKTIAELRQDIGKRPDLEQKAVAAVTARVDDLQRVTGLKQAPALLAEINGAKAPSLLLAAWSALPDAGFPQSAADLAAGAELYRTKVTPALQTISDPTRRQALLTSTKEPLTRMWIGLAKSDAVADGATLAQLFDAMDACGISVGDLATRVGPFMAFNYARYKDLPAEVEKVRQRLPNDPKAQVAAIADVLKQFWARPECAPFKSNAAQADLVRRLQRYEEGKGSVDFATVGPGAAGWQAAPSDDEGIRVVYTNGTINLTFLRVTPEDASNAAYMATTEMTVGLFAQLLSPEEIRSMMTAQGQNAGIDSRGGPRTWVITEGRLVPALVPPDGRDAKAGDWNLTWGNGWLYPGKGMQDGGLSYYPQGVNPAPPVAQTPINYVGVGASLLAARKLNCRLPTSQEWQQALAQYSSQDRNLRGQEWVAQHEFIQNDLPAIMKERKLGGTFAWPNGDIFLPTVPKDGQKEGDKQPATPGTDGWLWFRPVDDCKDPQMHDLVGNVAEFVVEDAGAAQSVAADEAAAKKLASDLYRAKQLKVIGASALSPPEIDPQKPESPIRIPTNNGYSDVGFRLAFSTEGGGGGGGKPAERLLALLRTAPYLTSKAAK